MDIFANMTSPRLAEIVYGRKDTELTTDLKDKIMRNLTGLERVFSGSTIRAYTEIIPVYQAGLLLQEDGYDLSKSKEGCLTQWFMGVRHSAIESRRKGISDPISILTNVNRQRTFWQEHLPVIYSNEGLFRKDKKRTFTELDKIKAWERQDGKCIVCGKAVRITDEGHHRLPHSQGGKTTSDNCILIHTECHSKLHSQLPLVF